MTNDLRELEHPKVRYTRMAGLSVWYTAILFSVSDSVANGWQELRSQTTSSIFDFTDNILETSVKIIEQ